MDSIDRQQPKENSKDLQGTEAREKIKELASKITSCFFCTGIAIDKPATVRPMSVQKVDEEGNFWFLSAIDSQKNQEIKADNTVQLLFQGSAHSDFLSVYGKATIYKDRELIKELWEPIDNTWFAGGVDDPKITVIKVETKQGYYWDNKHSNAVALIKMTARAIRGRKPDDSRDGHRKS